MHEGVRFGERRWPGLLRGGVQEVYWRKIGGHKSTSVVEQSCGAGISGRLASRSILPSREDQECHHPVSGAAPHQRLQHDFGCSLIWPAEPRKRQNAQVLVVKNQEKLQWKVKRLRNPGRVVRGNPTPPVTAKRPLAGSESMDTTALGAITPTQVQDNNQGPTQVSLSPRSQRLDTLQPPQSPVLADVVAQLQVLMEREGSHGEALGEPKFNSARLTPY